MRYFFHWVVKGSSWTRGLIGFYMAPVSSIGPYSCLPRSFLAYPAVLSWMVWWCLAIPSAEVGILWGLTGSDLRAREDRSGYDLTDGLS